MADQTSKARRKRLTKVQRKHAQRLKQAARKAGTVAQKPLTSGRFAR